jgi:hypothetical protein
VLKAVCDSLFEEFKRDERTLMKYDLRGALQPVGQFPSTPSGGMASAAAAVVSSSN